MDRLNSLDISHLCQDPRMISAGHSGQRLMFGPTLSGKVCLDDIKTGFYGRYADGISYADVRAGNVTYYTDPDMMRPFMSYGGIFPESDVEYEDYVDPNGIRKPHYRRINGRGDCGGCLSFIRDTNRVRADLLAANMWRRNQQNGFML